jgi:transposase
VSAPTQKYVDRQQVHITLDVPHVTMLDRIAASEAVATSSRSAAVEMLLDLYGGKVLERIQQETEESKLQPSPVEVTRWSAPKLGTEIIAYLAGLIRAGNMPDVAFNLAGVPPRTKTLWLKKGRNDRQEGREGMHADLVAAIERAEAECEAEDIMRLRAHGKTSWTALAWRLERQYPDRYAQRKRIDGKVQHSVFPVVDWDRLSPVETRTLVELLRKASPEMDDPGISRLARPALELVPGDVLDVIDGDAREVTHERLQIEAPPQEKPEP